ncbi:MULTISPECIES: signal peptidase I [unclassified Breznakia]|uniref:signal peptidase I n=1 Tax=unclassified Breznakia TaxID=2623764 RepID=UPI002405AC44|nr:MULTISPECIES: signal peptidase I [unclassified Breznakia]
MKLRMDGNTMNNDKEKTTTLKHRILTVTGIVLSIILIPMLIINVTLIVKSYTNPEEVPSIGGVVPMIVLTDSMYPKIHSGDLIICDIVDAEDVKKGDIITYFDPKSDNDAVVTHRVVKVIDKDGDVSFVTKGDANNTNDDEAVTEKDLIGVYNFRIAGAGDIAMFMQTTPGLLICVVTPLALLIGYDIMRRRKYDKTNKLETEVLMAELEELKKAQNIKTDVTSSEDSSGDIEENK